MNNDALTMEQVFEAIRFERARQDAKWGTDKPQSLPGFIAIVQHEAGEAMAGWVKATHESHHAPLCELLQTAAVAVAALQRYGIRGSAFATNDLQDGHGVQESIRICESLATRRQ